MKVKILIIVLFQVFNFVYIAKAQNLSFSGGSTHSIMLCQNGEVYTMGANWAGQLGQNNSGNTAYDGTNATTASYSIVPIKVLRGAQPTSYNNGTNLGSIRQVDAGSGAHNLALDCEGFVYSWGWNAAGQVGDNTLVNNLTPVKVLNGLQSGTGTDATYLDGVVYISGGNENSYAILSNGDAMAWGLNADGQLGDGTLTNSSTPVYILKSAGVKLTNVVQIDGGDDFGIALLADGTVWTWGNNANKQLGDNTGTDRSYATQVFLDAAKTQPLTNIVSITAGDVHCLALTSSGKLYAWGGNWGGQIAYPSGGADVGLPVFVQMSATGPDLTGVAQISGGNNFSIVSMTNSSVMTWGGTGAGNYFGQTGTGAASSYPVTVPGLSSIIGVSEGDLWSFAVNSSGSVYVFGQNAKTGGGAWFGGSLGLGITGTSQPTPTLITLPCTLLQACPVANVGPDLTLCNPSTATINSGSLLSGNVYVWKKDNVVITGQTSSSLTVTQPGTYRVIITNPSIINGCGSCSADSDEVVVTSLINAAAVDPSYCSLPANLNFCVTGPSGSNYDWYAVASGGTKVNGAPSNCYSTTVNAVPAIYYAQDLATYPYTTGYNYGAANLTSANSAYFNNDPNWQMFDVYSQITLNTVQIYPTSAPGGCSGSFNVTVELHQNKTAAVLQTTTIAIPCANINMLTTVTLNWVIPAGTNYSLRLNGGANFRNYGGGAAYPLGISNIIYLNGTEATTSSYCQTCYGAFFNWNITAPNSCARIPVQAIQNCVAPVDFLFVKAKSMEAYSLITWATTNESGISHYEIERSFDGINFSTIGTMPLGKNGKDFNSNYYEFIDYEISSSTVYYRIKEVDISSTYQRSSIVVLDRNLIVEPMVYPNPSADYFNLRLNNTEGKNYDIIIYSMEGKRVESYELNGTELSFGKNLATGVYFVSIQSTNYSKYYKIIKSN